MSVLKLPKPIGYMRSQDVAQHLWMCYATRPAPEAGREPVALYTGEQLVALMSAIEARLEAVQQFMTQRRGAA